MNKDLSIKPEPMDDLTDWIANFSPAMRALLELRPKRKTMEVLKYWGFLNGAPAI